MKRYPKYILLPAALAVYFVLMALYAYRKNGYHLTDDILLGFLVEVVIITVLFFALRYLYRNRK